MWHDCEPLRLLLSDDQKPLKIRFTEALSSSVIKLLRGCTSAKVLPSVLVVCAGTSGAKSTVSDRGWCFCSDISSSPNQTVLPSGWS